MYNFENVRKVIKIDCQGFKYCTKKILEPLEKG